MLPNQDSQHQIDLLNSNRRFAGTAVTLAVGAASSLSLHTPPVQATPERELPTIEHQTVVASVAQSTTSSADAAPNLSPDNEAQVRFGRSDQGLSNSDSDGGAEPDTDLHCKNQPGTCNGIEFIDAKLPELQQRVQDLRSQMQQFQGEHTAQNLQTYQAILANRAVDITKQKAEVGQQLSDTELQILELQTLLAMEPYEANFTNDLLNQDARYQDRLQQLENIDRQIAVEFSQPELNQNKLDGLYSQYQYVSDELYYDAHDLLNRFMAISQTQASNPLWQEPMYQELLQRLMVSTHHQQVLSQRQSTIRYIEELLQGHRTELATLLREYASLHQQLETQTQVLQDYILKRQTLQAELEQQPQFSPALAATFLPSESVDDPRQAVTSPEILPRLFATIPFESQGEVALALFMGAGILTALARHSEATPRIKDYQLAAASPELVDGDIQLTEPEYTSLVDIFEDHTETDSEVFSAMAIAIVLQTFATHELRAPTILPVKLFSELSEFAQTPVNLPFDDIDLYADEAIEMTLNGLDFETTEITTPEPLKVEDVVRIFGPEVGALVAA